MQRVGLGASYGCGYMNDPGLRSRFGCNHRQFARSACGRRHRAHCCRASRQDITAGWICSALPLSALRPSQTRQGTGRSIFRNEPEG